MRKNVNGGSDVRDNNKAALIDAKKPSINDKNVMKISHWAVSVLAFSALPCHLEDIPSSLFSRQLNHVAWRT